MFSNFHGYKVSYGFERKGNQTFAGKYGLNLSAHLVEGFVLAIGRGAHTSQGIWAEEPVCLEDGVSVPQY